MRRLICLILLITPALLVAQPNPNGSEYPITVHVQSSHRVGQDKINNGTEFLTVVIEGKKYELASSHGDAILRVGDYKAKILHFDHPRTYEYNLKYELQFPDGKTREYKVVGEEE